MRVGFLGRRGVLSVESIDSVDSVLRGQGLEVRVALLHAVPVLVGVALLPAELLQSPVEEGSQERSEARSDEVDPEIAREGTVDNGGTQGPCQVERATREVDSFVNVSVSIRQCFMYENKENKKGALVAR